MQSKLIRPLVALGVAAAIGIPVADAAAKGHGSDHGAKGPKAPHMRALNVKGTVAGVGDGTIDVLVKNANHHGKALRGQTVTVDVASARIVVRDVNGDGSRDLADVAAGDRVVVHSRVAKGSAPDPAQPLVAKRVVDQGPPHAKGDDTGDADGGDDSDTPPTP
jgi:hypothetical protein